MSTQNLVCLNKSYPTFKHIKQIFMFGSHELSSVTRGWTLLSEKMNDFTLGKK